MPIGPRVSKGNTEPRIGPTPFSAKWIDDPPAPERPRRVPVGSDWLPSNLPGWLPSERLLSAFLVLVIVLATAAFSSGASSSHELAAPDVAAPGYDTAVLPTDSSSTATTAVVDLTEASVGGAGTDSSATGATTDGEAQPGDAVVGTGAGTRSTAGSGDTAAATEDVSARQAITNDNSGFPRDADGNLFPANRIVAYYGHPDDDPENNLMGILGMDTIDNTYATLMDQVAEWQAADPETNVIPAWEFIATVAQQEPQSDGTWLTDTDFDFIQTYIDFAADHDMLIFIDVQVGKRGVQGEVERLRPLLEQPNVMLAIDPEFAIYGDEKPGEDYGHITADDVNWAQQYLADLSKEQGIPQKVLMVHQFRYDMIENKENIQDTPGVELVLHADGHGAPELKEETYNVVITQWVDQIVFWPGFKVFYNRDDPDLNQYTDVPNMTPGEILQLDPVPYYISYQ